MNCFLAPAYPQGQSEGGGGPGGPGVGVVEGDESLRSVYVGYDDVYGSESNKPPEPAPTRVQKGNSNHSRSMFGFLGFG